MLAYKFLRTGAVGPFSGFTWPRPHAGAPGRWVHVDGSLASCRHGVHGCRLTDLPYWISDELWVLEVDGVHPGEHHVVARSGRLVERVRAWNPAAAAGFAEACTWRLRDRVAAALSAAGAPAQAAALAACGTLDELGAVAAGTRAPTPPDETPPTGTGVDVAHLVGYLVDALSFGAEGRACTVAFVGAHAAATADGRSDVERNRQVAWFRELITAVTPPASRG